MLLIFYETHFIEKTTATDLFNVSSRIQNKAEKSHLKPDRWLETSFREKVHILSNDVVCLCLY